MSHFYNAIIWDNYTHDKEYAVNLLAIVIKDIKTIPKCDLKNMKCKSEEPMKMKMLDNINTNQIKIDNNGLCALQHILDSIINIDFRFVSI